MDKASPTLLIVDDEKEICSMLERHFMFSGYKILTAGNGKEALDLLAQQKVDILLSDIMMPEMNGVELLRVVRQDYPMVRPIIMTGYVTLDNALACIRYGADACIFKPFTDLSKVDQAINDAIAKLSYWNKILKELRGLK